MNAPDRCFLPDIQSLPDDRRLALDAVGVSGLRYPVWLAAGSGVAHTVATFALSVALPAEERGTHMSRFVELLGALPRPLDPAGFRALAAAMCERLGAAAGEIEMRFPWFVEKRAPVSGARSLVDVEACWRARRAPSGEATMDVRVTVAATSLCPCSREISAYGAHNQRSHITIDARLAADVGIDELVAIAESGASCEVYGLLKRADEKHVTERAYDNPRFVEDLVREVALALGREPRIAGFEVAAENFESIHNHSAFARIARGRP